ncbi:polysaccharide lyase family 7 protein [Pseudonocardia xinjiangensis]|uniref:polysaccharide lyase family 7 protein n=1 Tax=Pseudonocardia xinjiangensis TaxID=75289 RepID=UPI003899CCFE
MLRHDGGCEVTIDSISTRRSCWCTEGYPTPCPGEGEVDHPGGVSGHSGADCRKTARKGIVETRGSDGLHWWPGWPSSPVPGPVAGPVGLVPDPAGPYFHLDQAGDGVVFIANAGGVTTSGSSCPRSELREMDGDRKAGWSNRAGTHTLSVRQAVTRLPAANPTWSRRRSTTPRTTSSRCGWRASGWSPSTRTVTARG